MEEDGHVDEDGHVGTAKTNGGPLLTDLALQEVTDDLELHLSLSALLTLPLVLITPSMIHWARSLRCSAFRCQHVVHWKLWVGPGGFCCLGAPAGGNTPCLFSSLQVRNPAAA